MFDRPGTMDAATGQQSVMVTFDLASVGYYNQLALFNVLNGAMNRGWVGFYRVSTDGFSIRSIDSGEQCVDSLTGVIICYVDTHPCQIDRGGGSSDIVSD